MTPSTSPVLILGARSDIALACARAMAKRGHPVQLAARNAASLEPEAQDLRLRGDVAATVHEWDALDPASFEALLASLPAAPKLVISAVGLMGTQGENERDPAAAARVIRSNFEGPALALGVMAERFADAGEGVIVGISSVAGERGRASNYVYGAAKAGFTAYLSGLRNRFAGTPVQVITVLPGFVATKMTAGLPLNPKLTAQPEQVAEAIATAIEKKRDVIYVKPVWRLVMAIIRALPEMIFKRTKL